MSAYIDATYVQQAIGTNEYNALIDSDSDVGTQLIQAASSMVDAALEQGGYSQPISGTAPDLVKVAALGALAPMLYGRKGLSVPEQFNLHIGILNRIANGEVPLPTLTADPLDGRGGVKFSKQGTSERPAVFSNGKLRGVW